MIGPRENPDGQLTVIGRDAVLQGDLECESGAHIEGRFDGRIEAGGRVEIAASGEANAEIEAAVVIVQGRLTGSLRARERASLGSGCQVDGSVVAARLKVEEGARLSLRVEAGPDAGKAGGAAGGKLETVPAGAGHNRIRT
jgi:cytoskeletal protein CcmA (bactofilin family)